MRSRGRLIVLAAVLIGVGLSTTATKAADTLPEPQTLDIMPVTIDVGFKGSETDNALAGLINLITQTAAQRFRQHGRAVVAEDTGRGVQTVTYDFQETIADDGQNVAHGDDGDSPGRRHRHFHMRAHLEDNDGDGQFDDPQQGDADEQAQLMAVVRQEVDQQDAWLRANVGGR